MYVAPPAFVPLLLDAHGCSQYHRTVPFDAILGGGKSSSVMTAIVAGADTGSCDIAEDVLGDLGVRQAIKAMPKNAKL